MVILLYFIVLFLLHIAYISVNSLSSSQVSTITSPDRTGAKVYYQSGGQCPRLPLKMKLALTRTTEP